MQRVDYDKIATIIKGVALEKIVPRFEALEEGHVRSKSGPGDLVTIADEEAEIELTKIFKDLHPGCHVVGEEAVSSGTVTRDVLKDPSQMVWIVDPVDGTHNFAHSIPKFGTMVALIQGGERVASWIYQIPTDRMVAAEKGAGVTINGQPFSPPRKIDDNADFSTMKAFISRKFMPPPMRPYLDEAVKRVADATTHFCCAWEYVEVLESKSAFSIYSRVEPWDHHAGVLLLEEAGYYIRQWDGTPYTAADLKGGVINAPSEALWNRIFESFLREPLKTLGFEP
jgi:fructose-1,6-bisphosphatase/inositol monophosphatase family enzyme